MNVLVINAGSSSLKYQLMNVETQEILAIGICEKVGSGDSFHKYGLGDAERLDETPLKDHDEAMALVIEALVDGPAKAVGSLSEIDAVGHRVVQGGQHYPVSTVIDEEAIEKITELSVLAPLHNPPALMGIHACRKHMPGVPMVAVFDTSFFQTLEPKAYMYPLPYELYEKHGVRKYGMHGTSHRYVSERAADVLGIPYGKARVITLHLGNGCSASAVKEGIAVDTSMGLTPLDGLMMGTRCGAIDPAIVPFVMECEGLDTNGVNNLMNKKSGLLGISGVSNDLRSVQEAAEAGNGRAALAIDMYAKAVKKYVGIYLAVMGGADGIVFTAGIGENSAMMREKILEGLEGLGIVLDAGKNALRGGERFISADDSPVKVMVIPTNEEYMIARDTFDLVSALSK
ncbi:MAG: acetate kinase [Eggerthellaceae bacterium]|nr:acetate kinase [Eggerthellaceae bacterium]MDR2715386.1 acetate kinase [Coriobacteriaceae bacterium]